MTGAGISVAAGIPDFRFDVIISCNRLTPICRTPGTGLYSNLQKYNLKDAQDVFKLSYFAQDPKPFCTFLSASENLKLSLTGDRFIS
ncbi:MAG: hypothetical protein H0U27_09050 [Nitrosopumilus sp.]|nr:hypothetical protein [Nitrosopumilus sp.]